MAYDGPDGLLALKRAFLAAEAECHEIGSRVPSGLAVLDGEANPEPELREQLDAARSRRLDLVEQIHRHPWWCGQENRYKADMVLLEAAKQP